MDLEITGAYIYFTIPIFGGINVTQTMLSQLIITVVLCCAFIFLGRGLAKRPGGRQVLIEKGVGMMQNLVASAMGEHNIHWTPFIATIFLSSLLGSYIGLTGFLRSTTADLSTIIVWAIMVSVIIWYNNIKNNGFVTWLKGFTEPMVVMTPMNIVSEIAQPLSMAFRHFGNVAGGGVISLLLYTALALASSALLNLITASGWIVSAVLIGAGIGLFIFWMVSRRKQAPSQEKKLSKTVAKSFPLILGIFSVALGVAGVLQASGLLPGIPVLTYGIPAVLSCYFDIFSGFIQAYVFTLLTMVYIAGSLPEPGSAPAEQ